jgi:hypothetical protein
MKPPSPGQVVEALACERLFPFVCLVFAHLKPDEPPLKPHWYLLAMCWWLEKVGAGLLLRSMIWLQPRALKSITVAVAFPCWQLGRKPSCQIMVVTYSERLSLQHARQRQSILESGWYKSHFPNVKIARPGSQVTDINTTAHGRILAASVEGTITGTGADFIILDDCMKPDDASSAVERERLKSWYDGTLSSRINQRRSGSIISIQQRIHEDDLPAHLLTKGYTCLSLPAVLDQDLTVEIGPGRTHTFRRGEYLCPERFDAEDARRQRIEAGPQAYSAQYLQDPIAAEGNLMQADWWGTYEDGLERPDFQKIVQSWDTGMSSSPKSNYSACITFGFRRQKWYILDVFRARLDYPDLRRAVVRQWRIWEAEIVSHLVV